MDKRVKSIEIHAERQPNKIVVAWRANVDGGEYGADIWLMENDSWADLEKAFRLLWVNMLDSVQAVLREKEVES